MKEKPRRNKINKRDPFIKLIKHYLTEQNFIRRVNFNDFSIYVDNEQYTYQFGYYDSDKYLLFRIPIKFVQGRFNSDRFNIEVSTETDMYNIFSIVQLEIGESVLDSI